ncbi:hypothetical protein DFH28DRAFT_1111254 [Melampsora americana]|nr:hypothetical protein DFH28DRAFT_1111254 [Melampsora americana]
MPQANGIQANLISDGIPLTEYPSTSTPSTVFCESKPGQTFVVKFSGPQAPSDCVVHLYCDGVYMDGFAIPRHSPIRSTFLGIYLPNDDTKLMPFKFANVELCEEDDSHTEQIVKNLGTVSMEVINCTLGPSIPSTTSKIPSVASKNKFSERNKKASMIPHTIGLGASLPASTKRPPTSRSLLHIDPTPYVRFVWQYRSRGMLITSGLIPRPASPLPDIQLSRPPVITHENDEPRPELGQEPRVDVPKDTKPDIKPKLGGIKPKISGIKPVVIDLCDDNATTAFFSSTIENPILINDDEDDEPIIQSTENLPQASSSSTQQVDIKPVKIELERAPDGQPNEKKRVQGETKVEGNDHKRVKLEKISHTQNDSDATLEDENSV